MIHLLFAILLIVVAEGRYKHKIEPFSFDIQKFEYPLEYWKVGATVALRDTIKVLPKVANRYGGLYLSQVSLIVSLFTPNIFFLAS
jgi:hypothetical protein